MICTLCLVIIRPIGTPSNPSTLGRITAVLARSRDLSNTLCQTGDELTSSVEKLLEGKDSVLVIEAAEPHIAFRIRTIPPDRHTVMRDLEKSMTWWQPMALQKPIKAAILLLPLALILVLEVTYEVSRRTDGRAALPMSTPVVICTMHGDFYQHFF